MLQNLDTKIFHLINNLAHRSGLSDEVFIFLSKYSLIFFGLTLIYYFLQRRKVFWTALVSAILSRGIITELIRFLYQRPRPFAALDQVKLLIPKDGSEPSFPSGHAVFLFAVAFAVYLYDKKIGGILILAALLASIARIYTGIHYPSDILGGAAVAYASVYLVKKAKRRDY